MTHLRVARACHRRRSPPHRREEGIELGEPSDRTAVSIEDTIKREYERWIVVHEEDSEAHQTGGRRRRH